jgi:hypothetical protein
LGPIRGMWATPSWRPLEVGVRVKGTRAEVKRGVMAKSALPKARSMSLFESDILRRERGEGEAEEVSRGRVLEVTIVRGAVRKVRVLSEPAVITLLSISNKREFIFVSKDRLKGGLGGKSKEGEAGGVEGVPVKAQVFVASFSSLRVLEFVLVYESICSFGWFK